MSGATPGAEEAYRKQYEKLFKEELSKIPEVPASGFVGWPEGRPLQYNACTDPCDMWTGPCACGAWHKDGV